jgi:hypothetical protein
MAMEYGKRVRLGMPEGLRAGHVHRRGYDGAMRLAEAYTNEEDSKGGKERSDSHKVQADLPAISHKRQMISTTRDVTSQNSSDLSLERRPLACPNPKSPSRLHLSLSRNIGTRSSTTYMYLPKHTAPYGSQTRSVHAPRHGEGV